MKKVIYPLLCSLMIPTLIYFAFSFANTDFNIKNWHEENRTICSFLMFTGICFGIVLGVMTNQEIKNK